MKNSNIDINRFIIEEAKKLGFSNIGFSRCVELTDDKTHLQKWIDSGYNAGMTYMNNNFDKRANPTLLVPGAKSVISFSYNYFTDKKIVNSKFRISKYAYGRDYHKVIKKKLKILYSRLRELNPEIEGRFFVDSAPVLERAWARKSGLGWIGKNSMLINPNSGSYFFISEMILNIDLNYNEYIINNHCGTCTRCIDACPTSAISKEGYFIDSNKCISFLTIENKGKIGDEFKNKMNNYIFGCDICQDVCPWNRFSTHHDEVDFLPKEELLKQTDEDWKELDESKFETLFSGSAIKRAKFKGLSRNILFSG